MKTGFRSAAAAAAWVMAFGMAGMSLPRAAHASRATSAPPEAWQILAYAESTPAPSGGGTDSTSRETENPNLGKIQTPQAGSGQGGSKFNQPDSSFHANFNSAPLETLGPGSSRSSFVNPAPTPLPAGTHAKRGIFGVQPLVLLAGIVALHILVVSTVVK